MLIYIMSVRIYMNPPTRGGYRTSHPVRPCPLPLFARPASLPSPTYPISPGVEQLLSSTSYPLSRFPLPITYLRLLRRPEISSHQRYEALYS